MHHDASPGLANYSTAGNTRSLGIIPLSKSGTPNSSYTNQTILYYETPNGKISALLQRLISAEYQWIDITNQESQSLPHNCRNGPNSESSQTLYESEDAVISTPFLTGWIHTPLLADGVGYVSRAFFYSPENEFVEMDYNVASTSCREFSTGIHYLSSF